MITYKDEILNESVPHYNIYDSNGSLINERAIIELASNVTQQGTELNKAFFDSIKKDLEQANVVYELTPNINTSSSLWKTHNLCSFPSSMTKQNNNCYNFILKDTTTSAFNYDILNGLTASTSKTGTGISFNESTKENGIYMGGWRIGSSSTATGAISSLKAFDGNSGTCAGPVGIGGSSGTYSIAFEFPFKLNPSKITFIEENDAGTSKTFTCKIYASNTFNWDRYDESWTEIGTLTYQGASTDTKTSRTINLSNTQMFKCYKVTFTCTSSDSIALYELSMPSGTREIANKSKKIAIDNVAMGNDISKLNEPFRCANIGGTFYQL